MGKGKLDYMKLHYLSFSMESTDKTLKLGAYLNEYFAKTKRQDFLYRIIDQSRYQSSLIL